MNLEVQITAIVATHNRDHFLPLALDSIADQSAPPYEVIVVDDAPSDATRDIVTKFASVHPELRVRYLPFDKESRLGAVSRNWAVEISESEYFAWLDDDDRWKRNYLEGAASAIQKRRSDVVLTGFVEVGPDGQEVGRCMPPSVLRREDFSVNNPGAVTSNIVFKRDSFLAVGGYDASLLSSCDRAIFIEFLLKGFDYQLVEEFELLRAVGHGDQWSLFHERVIRAKCRFARRYWGLMSVDERVRTAVKLTLVALAAGKERIGRFAKGLISRFHKIGGGSMPSK